MMPRKCSVPLSRPSGLLLLTILAMPTACSSGRPLLDRGDLCIAPSLSRPDEFQICSEGSGSFGSWILDRHGLPAYEYTLDQTSDPRAAWTTTSEETRTDHLFQIGNDRLVAMASNDGFTSIFFRDHLPTFLNRVFVEKGRTGGGYSFVSENGEVWSTAYLLKPVGASTRRVFGMASVLNETTYRGIFVGHEISAPHGDSPYLVDQVTVRNESDRTRSISHYEFWDVFRHSLELQLLRSGDVYPDLPASMDRQREGINRLFTLQAEEEGTAVRIIHRYQRDDAPEPDEPSSRDLHPHDIFLARLLPPVEESPLRFHTDRKAFYGDGTLDMPEAPLEDRPPEPLIGPVSAEDQPAVLVDRVDLTLLPGEERKLRYAYGFVESGSLLFSLDHHKNPSQDSAEAAAHGLKASLPFFVCPEAPFLHREAAWHAAQLMTAAVYDEYMGAHTVVQGSAYMYLHGLDGAARDYALFSIPLIYMRPDLAREILRTMMRMTHADTDQISYAVQGHGLLEDAIIHHSPSDLDLFFLWALSEYVAATGDRSFLDEMVSYWPRSAGRRSTVAGHARTAFRHLKDVVGRGSHGLVRIGTGDWSDGIVATEAPDRQVAEEEGESVPNTQMAVWVLPRAGSLFDERDPDLAAEMREYGRTLKTEAAEEWVEQWYRRAWFSPEDPFGEGHLNLESQVWAFISQIPDVERRDILAGAILEKLDLPSEVGARRVEGGMVWHAISGLLTWGYKRVDHDLAWGSLLRHTLHSYAVHNPDQWYGIWSGPDGIGVNGGTWSSAVTPTKDWPVMNANQHAMPLLALLRVAGIEPSPQGDGLVISPSIPSSVYVLDLPLLELSVRPGRIVGSYRACVNGSTVLYIAPPAINTVVTVDGRQVDPEIRDGLLLLPIDFTEGQEISFDLRQVASETL